MTTLYPEGLTKTIDDRIIDDAKDFYNKDEITDTELYAYIEAKKAMGGWDNVSI